MLRIGLVSNLKSRGLALDATLIGAFLSGIGHEATLIQYDEEHSGYYDLLIFFERIVPEFLSMSRGAPWLFTNPEFLFESDFDLIRSSFGRVLCKTKEAHRICSELFPDQAVYTGFIAQDKYDQNIMRGPTFLHVAGNSRVKGTTAVIDAWRWKCNGEGIGTPLIVVADWVEEENLPENVTVLKKISDEELTRLQNQCVWHLQPSGTEGFSHTIREAMSVGAEILTTNAPPMNEINAHFVVPSSSYKFHQAEIYEIDAKNIHGMVKFMLEAELDCIDVMRQQFLRGNEEFKQKFTALLASFNPDIKRVAPPRPREFPEQKRIAFLGNFEPPYSTENDMAWALERLGHEVHRLQENSVELEVLSHALQDCDAFLFVHTHSFHWIDNGFMEDILSWLRQNGKVSISAHLDKFLGIPDREKQIGTTAFWKSDYVFTADGSAPEEFEKRGVNHFWMKPAISELFLHPGSPKHEYMCDVGFVGAKGYHSEYPWRAEMIEFLEHTYRDRFKLVNGVRGHELNDVYASLKVVVGDCFASGLPRYYSDRMVETPGRYGFLLSPEIEGLDIPLMTYKPQSLADLKCQIDYWLPLRKDRREITTVCADYIRNHDTWTIRMRTILETAFHG